LIRCCCRHAAYDAADPPLLATPPLRQFTTAFFAEPPSLIAASASHYIRRHVDFRRSPPDYAERFRRLSIEADYVIDYAAMPARRSPPRHLSMPPLIAAAVIHASIIFDDIFADACDCKQRWCVQRARVRVR